MSDLYAVIATLDGQESTKELLDALADDGRFRVLIVDNGSQPEFRTWLYSLQSDGIIVICNQFNAGVASAWNTGIRIAIQNNAPGVLVAGNDTVPQPGAIDRMVGLAQAGCPFVTGTQVIYQTPIESCAPLMATDSIALAPDFSFFYVPTLTIEVLARHEASTGSNVSPWCMGLFDERFFPAYFEDNDFHLRLHRAGLVAVRDPKAIFRHRCSQTIQIHPQLAAQNQATFQRNAEFFRTKYGKLPHELDTPPQARPLNVTDEQWARMTGGRPLIEIDQAAVAAQARQTYARYGIQ